MSAQTHPPVPIRSPALLPPPLKYLVGDGQDMELPFTVAVTPFEKENSSIRGLARIYLDECFAVSNISLIMGKNGMFVSMPSYKTNQIGENNKEVYRDICYPVTGEFREKVNNMLTAAYERAVAKVQENVLAQADGFVPHRKRQLHVLPIPHKVFLLPRLLQVLQ